MYDAVVRSAMMYEVEPLAVKKAQENTFDVMEMRRLGLMCGGKKLDRIWNESGRNSQESVKPASHQELIRRSWPTHRLPTLPTI